MDSRAQSLPIIKNKLAMKEENYILFDQYIQNEMTVDQKVIFENQLVEDQELAAAFISFKETISLLENKLSFDEERSAFRESLHTIGSEHYKTKKPKVVNLKPLFFLAVASVVLLLGLFVFNPSSDPNFKDFNQFEEAHFVERGTSTENLKQAEQAYNTKNYKKAIPLFESILKEKQTAEFQYFYAISLLEINKTSKSEAVFQKLKSGNSIYKNKAIYGLALAKLKQKEYQSCKEILLTIPKDYENYDAVEKLLKAID